MSARIEIRQGNLTGGHETVLVNASNTNGTLGSGVSGAIRKACGPQSFQGVISEALFAQFKGPMPPGAVLMTNAGAHPVAKWVAHVAVMDYRNGYSSASVPTMETIRAGCDHLWRAIERLPGADKHSVAMVALGAGTGGLGVAEPTRVAAETLHAHLMLHPGSRIERVTFYGYLDHEYLAMAEVLKKWFPELKKLG